MCGKPALFIIKENTFRGLEGRTAVTALRRLLRHEGKDLADLHEIDNGSSLTVSDVLSACGGTDVFIFVRGRVLIAGASVALLAETALYRGDLWAIAPVLNLTGLPTQFQAPPFFYQTLLAFRWVAREVHRQFQNEVAETDGIDDGCVAVRREILMRLPGNARLKCLPELIREGTHRYGIARGAYAHRYGNLYESAREDLLPLVPPDAREILDIGCAHGRFGELLKNRQPCRVVGVDSDPGLLSVARARLDEVIDGGIETLLDGGLPGPFDCIVCGDVLEHLDDPWHVVRGLRRHLKGGGRVVASVPNVANWAIICEMLKGRWDYVPFTILSGTHVRFFTRETLRECFEDAGYKVIHLDYQRFGLPPEGALFIEDLKRGLGEIDEDALKASEIVIAATNG